MSRLGDFLEAVYGPRDRFATVRATLRYWQDRLYADVAADNRAARHAARLGREAGPRAGWAPDAGPRVSEAEVHVWLAGGGRGREDVCPTAGDHWFPRVVVTEGVHRWSRTRAERPERRAARAADRHAGALAHADRHFGRPFLRQLFESLDLEEVGASRTAGHECVRVRAVPAPGERLWPHWFPFGGDEYELHVDPDRAAVLSIVGRVGPAVFETNDVAEVVYDEPADDRLFPIPT